RSPPPVLPFPLAPNARPSVPPRSPPCPRPLRPTLPTPPHAREIGTSRFSSKRIRLSTGRYFMKAIIIGAGIGGLAVARGLLARGWDFVVYEQATSFSAVCRRRPLPSNCVPTSDCLS